MVVTVCPIGNRDTAWQNATLCYKIAPELVDFVQYLEINSVEMKPAIKIAHIGSGVAIAHLATFIINICKEIASTAVVYAGQSQRSNQQHP